MSARARIERLTVLAIAGLRAELGALVRELRVVATSQLARKPPQTGATPAGPSLAREIRHSAVEPPHIVYLHRDGDVVLLSAELELLLA